MDGRVKSAAGGTWLCPTEFDRARLRDMEARLQWARAVMFGALGIGFAIAIPWLGWWPVVLVVAQVTVYGALRPVIARSARPEYPVACAVVLAQVLIAAAVAVTGAGEQRRPPVFLLGVAGLPARFGTNGVVGRSRPHRDTDLRGRPPGSIPPASPTTRRTS